MAPSRSNRVRLRCNKMNSSPSERTTATVTGERLNNVNSGETSLKISGSGRPSMPEDQHGEDSDDDEIEFLYETRIQGPSSDSKQPESPPSDFISQGHCSVSTPDCGIDVVPEEADDDDEIVVLSEQILVGTSAYSIRNEAQPLPVSPSNQGQFSKSNSVITDNCLHAHPKDTNHNANEIVVLDQEEFQGSSTSRCDSPVCNPGCQSSLKFAVDHENNVCVNLSTNDGLPSRIPCVTANRFKKERKKSQAPPAHGYKSPNQGDHNRPSTSAQSSVVEDEVTELSDVLYCDEGEPWRPKPGDDCYERIRKRKLYRAMLDGNHHLYRSLLVRPTTSEGGGNSSKRNSKCLKYKKSRWICKNVEPQRKKDGIDVDDSNGASHSTDDEIEEESYGDEDDGEPLLVGSCHYGEFPAKMISEDGNMHFRRVFWNEQDERLSATLEVSRVERKEDNHFSKHNFDDHCLDSYVIQAAVKQITDTYFSLVRPVPPKNPKSVPLQYTARQYLESFVYDPARDTGSQHRILVYKDLSKGILPYRLPVFSDVLGIDDECPPPIVPFNFKYITANIMDKSFQEQELQKNGNDEMVIRCDCSPETSCYDIKESNCPCKAASDVISKVNMADTIFSPGGYFIDYHNKRDFHESAVVLCGPLCGCSGKCRMRYSEVRKIMDAHQLEIFSRDRVLGYGVRTLSPIGLNQAVCEFLGKVQSAKELNHQDGLGADYSYNLSDSNSTLARKIQSAASAPVRKLLRGPGTNAKCYINPYSYGNVARFISHACLPNLRPVRVIANYLQAHKHHLFFVASMPIPPGMELFMDYGEGYIADRQLQCKCKTVLCQQLPVREELKKIATDDEFTLFLHNIVSVYRDLNDVMFKKANRILSAKARRRRQKKRANHTTTPRAPGPVEVIELD